MQNKPVIQLLPDQVINKIAAGEVVERPASVMKELFENALDAGATQVEVEVVRGGRQLIAVTDNGCGMTRDQALLSIERHATSKIRSEADIENIHTLGFRGEALAAISSVSRFTLITRPAEALAGTEIQIAGGKMVRCEEIGCPVGTRIEIRNLFFNVPARRKFLRAEQTELAHIRQLFLVHALAHPGTGMSLKVDERMLYHLPMAGRMEDRISELYNPGFFEQLRPIEYTDSDYTLSGYAGLPQTGRKDRQDQYIFVNGRPAAAPVVYHALNEVYHALIAKGRYPAVFLFIEMEPALVDVNVHPTKKEVRFHRPNQLRDAVVAALSKALTFQGREQGAGGREQGAGGREQRTEEHRTSNIEHPTSKEEIRRSEEPPASVATDNLLKQIESEGLVSTANLKPQTSSLEPPPAMRPRFETQKQMDDILVRPEVVQRSNVGRQRSDEHRTSNIEHPTSKEEIRRSEEPPASVATDNLLKQIESEGLVSTANLKPQTASPQPQTANLKPPTASPWGWCRIVGRIGEHYVVLETEDGFVLMEPRAAHERVLFEKFLAAVHEHDVHKQGLLAPETVDLLPSDAQIVRDYIDALQELGFGISEFGGDTFIIDALPVYVQEGPVESLLVEIARELETAGKKRGARALVLERIAQAACQTAVRVKERLSDEEIEKLVADLARTEMPYTSPRGRPTLIYTSFTELNRKFSRD